MPQVTTLPTRGKLVTEPEIRALHVVKFALSGRWLPEGEEKLLISNLKFLESKVPESEDPELHELVRELLNSVHVSHVLIEQCSRRAIFYVQLRADVSCDPLREKARVGRLVRKSKA